MRERRSDLETPLPVLLVQSDQEEIDEDDADQIDKVVQVPAVIEIIERGEESDVHPEHLVYLEPPLPHVDGIVPRKQNGQKVEEVEENARRKQPHLVPETADHAQQQRKRKERNHGEGIPSRGTAPVRQGQNIQRDFPAGEVEHAREKEMTEQGKQAAHGRHERHKVQKDERECQCLDHDRAIPLSVTGTGAGIRS